MIDIALNYKLTKYPDKYNHYLSYNSFRLLLSLFGSLVNLDDITYTPQTDISDTISQIINVATITKESADSDVELFYETELTKDNGLSTYIFNPLILSEDEISMSLATDNKFDETKTAYLLFHTASNIQFLIDNFSKVESDTYDEAKGVLNIDLTNKGQLTYPRTNGRIFYDEVIVI